MKIVARRNQGCELFRKSKGNPVAGGLQDFAKCDERFDIPPGADGNQEKFQYINLSGQKSKVL